MRQITFRRSYLLLLLYLLQIIVVSIFSIFTSEPNVSLAAISIMALLSYVFFFKVKIHWDCVFICVFVWLSFYIALKYHPEYAKLYSEQLYIRILSIAGGPIGYIIIRQYSSIEDIKNIIKISTVVLFAYYTLKVLGFNAEAEEEGGMRLAYGMIVASIGSLAFALTERKRFWVVLSVLCFFETLYIGQRGPLLCFVFFIVFYYLLLRKDNLSGVKKILYILVIFIVIALLVFYIEDVMRIFYNTFSGILGGTRIMEKMASGEMADSSGRDGIYLLVIEKIFDGNNVAYGPLSDQYMLGVFSHNIALELMITYGFVPGLIITIFVLVEFFIIMLSNLARDARLLYLIFFSCSIPRLCVSNSFWYDSFFWITLGFGSMLLYDIFSKKKRIINY